ncbi:hypothetical protein [Jeongeupia chitinilytica]|uniref:Uncharacterized protein n=1 Tax=Jeongeupia chitinilytica TaxID=1041641 RepID=A0ABQ3H3U7_9NEIS|nr:hypothetical protein [Jeongeupia chitinilytica]GHD66016.1 hypothetical protein GCM10007350_27540 [Jeongeupia chitinilytica]
MKLRHPRRAITEIWLPRNGQPGAFRVLQFRNNRFSSNDHADLRWQRQGCDWQVEIDGTERHRIPHALICG